MAFDAKFRERAADLSVGMVIPLQGPAGLVGPSCEAIIDLAVHEFNQQHGILGRELKVRVIDGGAPPAQVASEVHGLLRAGAIDAVAGWHISSVRHAIAPVVADRVPYVYTALYEGGERRPGVYCTGETPGSQVEPALRWLRDHVGLRDWFIVGADYVWPRSSAVAARHFARQLDLRIVGETFVELGAGDMDQIVRELASTPCDGVLMLLVGQDAVRFNRAFAEHGLHERMARFSPHMEENMLLASGTENNRNLFVSAGYFRSLASADALDLVAAYTALHGPAAPPLNNAAVACYDGLHAFAHLTHRAGSVGISGINTTLDGAAYHGPRGTVEFHGRQAAQRVHLAVADGCDFDVLTCL